MENQPIINSSDTSSVNPVSDIQVPALQQTKTNLIMPILVTLLVSGVIFGFGGYYVGKQSSIGQQLTSVSQNAPGATLQTSPSPALTTYTSTTVNVPNNMKVYTNTTFNFSFQYPSDLFVYQGSPQTDSQYWSNKINGGAPLELGQDGIWLNMSFSNPGPTMTSFYNKIINLKVNESISESAVTKLSDLSTNGIKGAVYFQGVPANFAGEAAYTYEAVWIKGDLVYRLSLSAFTQNNLQNQKKTFDQILSTFKFTQ